MNEQQHPLQRREALTRLVYGLGGLSAVSVVGCSRILLSGGKILFGDPKVQSEFTKLTKENLTKGTKTILVVCSCPESVEDEIATVKLDIIDGVTRQLHLKGVNTVDSDRVAEWIDDHDGVVSNTQEIARDFETDYIVWIDIDSFRLHEPNSQKLLRGNTSGYVSAYKVQDPLKSQDSTDQRMALRVYKTPFSLTYPEHQAVSSEGRSMTVFYKDYIKRLCDLLSERFYDHRPGSQI